MKKYLTIVLSVLCILSFAVVASAQEPTVTLGGKMLVRGWYFSNVLNDLPQETDSQALYTTNIYLTVDAKVSDNVQGFIELESSGGENRNSGLYIWGQGAVSDTKPNADFGFRQAWIQYTSSGLLGVPSGIKVGHQLITLGEKQFLNNERFGDDAIILWTDPTKEFHLAAGTAKLNEGIWTNHSDDIDGYLLLGTYKLNKDNTIGANYTWIHSDVALADSVDLSNIGLHANGKVAGLSYAAEVDLQFGDMAAGDFGGYGIFAKLGYMLDPVGLRASFAYGSGDDDPADGDIEEFQVLQGPDENTALARFPHYTMIYERTMRTTSENQALTLNTRTTGIANTTYYNLGLDVNPTKDMSLSVDGFIIRASESDNDKDAGTELDARASYKLAKNLSYFVEAAGFWPGDYYKQRFGNDENVTQLIHGLCLTF